MPKFAVDVFPGPPDSKWNKDVYIVDADNHTDALEKVAAYSGYRRSSTPVEFDSPYSAYDNIYHQSTTREEEEADEDGGLGTIKVFGPLAS